MEIMGAVEGQEVSARGEEWEEQRRREETAREALKDSEKWQRRKEGEEKEA